MVQSSINRRNVLIASIIVVVLVISSSVSVIYLLTKDNVTVSGKALVSGSYALWLTIQTIEFTDTQTGTKASSHITLTPHSSNEGNYSVVLKNGHTYNVYINFYELAPDKNETKFIKIFTVNVSAGQKEITKDFMYPNPPWET
jgi:hypothetical protein